MGVTSTFGGSLLTSRLIDFETAPDADLGGMGGDVVDPAGGAGDAAPPPDDGGAPSWQGPSQEEWEQTRQALEYMAQFMPAAAFQQPEPQQQQVMLDPLDDGFQGQLDRYFDEKLAPLTDFVQSLQFREGEARAQDIIADLEARDGEFIFEGSRDTVRSLANNLIVETNQQYPGDPVRAAEAALEQAAQKVREWETEVGKRYHERQINQLGTLAGAGHDLPAGGTNGSQQFTIPQGGSLVDVAYRHGAGR